MTVSPADAPLAVRDIHGHVATTATSTLAFWVLPDVDWVGMDARSRAAHRAQWADAFAALAGRRIWLYGDHLRFPAAAYANEMRAAGEGALPAFGDAVERATWLMETLDAGVPGSIPGVSRPVTVLAVRVAERATAREHIEKIMSDEPIEGRLGDLERDRLAYREVASIVERIGAGRHTTDRDAGLERPRPMEEEELWWLITARRAAGHVAEVGGPDIAVTATRGEVGVVPVTAAGADGWPTVRYVHTMRVRLFKDRPDTAPPWLASILDSDVRPSFTAMFDLVPGGEGRAGVAEVRAAQLAANLDHMEEHGARTDATTESAAATSVSIADELADPDPVVATRACGLVLVHVSGDSPQSCREAARQVRAELTRGDATSDRGPGLVLTSPPAQWAEYRSGVPGEVLGVTGTDRRGRPVGYVSEQPLSFLAASAPGASLHAGSPTGWPVGNIVGSLDMFMFDVFGGSASNRSNVIGVGGEQGSGKTSVLSLLADVTVKEGIRAMVLDPSGRMAGLAAMPQIRDVSRVLNVGRRTPGVLAPHTLVVDPDRAAFDTIEEYREALRDAAARRVSAALDIVRMVPTMLPDSVRDAAHEAAQSAIGKLGGEYGLHPSRIIDAIEAEGEAGARFAQSLRAYASMPDGQVFFGDPVAGDGGALLTVITVEGYETPPDAGVPRSEWTTRQLQSAVVTYAATLMAGRLLWADRDRKLILLDEQSSQVGSGGDAYARFLTRAATDSRKFAGAVVLAMHTAETLASINPGFVSLMGAHIQMRTERSNAAGFLSALRVRAGVGWEEHIEGLDTGVAVIRGWDDRVRTVPIDRSWWTPELVATTENTPVTARPGVAAAVGRW